MKESSLLGRDQRDQRVTKAQHNDLAIDSKSNVAAVKKRGKVAYLGYYY